MGKWRDLDHDLSSGNDGNHQIVGANGKFYYYQDKLGSTTHIANASGALLESYRYDLWGAPSYSNSTSLNSSTPQPTTSSTDRRKTLDKSEPEGVRA